MDVFGEKGKVIMIKKIGYNIAFIGLFVSFLTILTAWSIVTSLNIVKNESVFGNPTVLSVELDVNSISGDQSDVENSKLNYPSKKDYEDIAKLEEVESYEINLLDIYISPNLLDFSDEESSDFGLFFVKGITESTIFDQRLNNIRLTAGRLISDDEIRNGANSVLISEEVAKRNNLKAGSDFILQISNLANPKETIKQERHL